MEDKELENKEELKQEELKNQGTATDEGEEKKQPEKTFTQEQLNDIIRTRIEKEQARLLKKLGVNELDELLDNNKKISDLESKLTSLIEENAFMKNNVNPKKYDDIRAYFKGKGIEFTNEKLAEELKTHEEWLNKEDNKTTIKSLSSIKQDTPPQDDSEVIKKLFGLSELVKK